MGKNCVVAAGSGVYLTGSTNGAGSLTTAGAFQESLSYPSFSNLLVKFNSNGQRDWATYVGNSTANVSAGFGYPNLSTDDSQNIYLSNNNSLLVNLASPGSFQENVAGNFDAFTVKFNPNGERQWGTFYGGTGSEFTPLKTLVSGNDFYFVGMTNSTNGISTPGSFQATYATNSYQSPSTSSPPSNIFIAKFTPVLSVNEFYIPKSVLYPNPATDSFALQNRNGANQAFGFQIFDITGRAIKNGQGNCNAQINIEDLAPGNYIVKVDFGHEAQNHKLVKR